MYVYILLQRKRNGRKYGVNEAYKEHKEKPQMLAWLAWNWKERELPARMLILGAMTTTLWVETYPVHVVHRLACMDP